MGASYFFIREEDSRYSRAKFLTYLHDSFLPI